MKHYKKTTPDIVQAVQWKGNNILEVCELIPENVYEHYMPQNSLLLKDAVGSPICPLQHFIVKEGDRHSVMDPKYFQHAFKELIDGELQQM